MARGKREETEYKDYSEETQKLLIQFMISHPNAFVRCQNIVKAEYWSEKLRPAVRYLMKFSNEYRALPTPEQIQAECKLDITRIDNIQENHVDWFLNTVEDFCRHRAMEALVFDGPKLIAEGNYAELERRSKENMLISLQTELGTDYFMNPLERLETMRRKTDTKSTGWRDIDRKLYGGLNRGELTIFAGGPGSGKSLFLQNLALNWVMMGLNVVYISLELSEELVGLRIDSMITGVSTSDIFKNMEQVAMRLGAVKRQQGAQWGKFHIKKMPMAGTSANDIRAYLKEYEIQTGIRPDALLVDYLDLLTPFSVKIQAGDQFIKDKYTSEELRALAVEWNVLCGTASQLNRTSVQESNYDISHIAGGISKINTADNVMAIHTSQVLRSRGLYELQFLKTRSSSGVGQHVTLSIDPSSLRISDFDGEEAGPSEYLDSLTKELKDKKEKEAIGTNYTPSSSTGLTKTVIGPATKTIVGSSGSPAPSKVQAQGSKLRSLLGVARNGD